MQTVVHETEMYACYVLKAQMHDPRFFLFSPSYYMILIQSNARTTVFGEKNCTAVFVTDFLCSDDSVAKPTILPFQFHEPRFEITQKLSIHF